MTNDVIKRALNDRAAALEAALEALDESHKIIELLIAEIKRLKGGKNE